MFGMQQRWYRFSGRMRHVPAFTLPLRVFRRGRTATVSLGSDASSEPATTRPTVAPQHWSPARPALREDVAAHIRYAAWSPDRPCLRTDASARFGGPSGASRR